METGDQRATHSWCSTKVQSPLGLLLLGQQAHIHHPSPLWNLPEKNIFLKESQLPQEQMVLWGQPRAGKGTSLQVGSPGALPHPCPHHLCDCGPRSLVKNEGVPYRERGGPRPRSPEVLRMDTTLASRKIYFLGICPYGCLPTVGESSRPPLCLTDLFSGLAGCGWSLRPPAHLPLPLPLPVVTALEGGGDEIRTSIIMHDSGLDRIS